MKAAWSKVRTDPVGSARRAWDKLFVGRLRYADGKDYDASRYWRDRFSKHGTSLRGAGDEGLDKEENERAYNAAAETFKQLIAASGIEFGTGRTLEIGCGPGFYTRLLVSQGAQNLVAYDITDVLFDELRAELPGVEFRKADITQTRVDGTFDRALMIDVLEHVVNDQKFTDALRNVADAVAPDGRFVVGPFVDEATAKRHLYYVRFWSLDEMRAALPEWEIEASTAFRDGDLVVLRRARTS